MGVTVRSVGAEHMCVLTEPLLGLNYALCVLFTLPPHQRGPYTATIVVAEGCTCHSVQSRALIVPHALRGNAIKVPAHPTIKSVRPCDVDV